MGLDPQFRGVWFLAKQVSMKVLWWLALAMIMRAALSRFPLESRSDGCPVVGVVGGARLGRCWSDSFV